MFLFKEKKPIPHINENLWILKFGDIPASHCQKRIREMYTNFQSFIWYVLIISYFFTFLGANDSSGVGSDLAKQWEITLRQALMPVTQGTSDTNAAVAGPKNNSHR